MSKVFILEETLSDIGSAIREKTGKTDLIAPGNMPAEIRGIVGGSDPVIKALEVTTNGTYNIYDGVDGFGPVVVNVPQDGAPPASAFNITGDAPYRFTGSGWNWFLERYGKQIDVTVTRSSYMFSQNPLTEIPFEIKMDDYYGMPTTANNLFEWSGIHNPPKFKTVNGGTISDINNMFLGCYYLREVPTDYFKDCDFVIESYRQWGNIYNYCYSLRICSFEFFELDHQANGYSSVYYGTFENCESLDRIVDLPVTYETRSQLSNNFIGTFDNCSRLDRLTFKTKDIVYPWSNQTINLSDYVGYASSNSNIISYNSGIGLDKEVKDMETYEALKNDPDWHTCDVRFSRYNHDSAVETINSLPNTSGSNTIVFKGDAGSLTDGGAINTLTEEEIAVAAAKGWTVSLT